MTAILFDLDGVLIDSRKAITTCINHALREQGRAERPAEELYGFIGETKAATIATALEAVDRPAVMIGDRHHDVEGARANGIPCIGVVWGIGSRGELDAAGAVALVDRPADLPRLLKEFEPVPR